MDETTCRRTAFERLQIPIGYGVEIAPLDDIPPGYGPNGIAQIDLGRRSHSHQSIHDLALMSSELLATALRRMAVPTPAGQRAMAIRSSISFAMAPPRHSIDRTPPRKISRSAHRIAVPRQRIHLMGEPYCPSSTM
jgi:glucosyl-3-phosphoglycerate synthase